MPTNIKNQKNSQLWIREREILERFQFSSATLWRKAKNGTFPKPVKLSANITAWRLSEVEQWEASLSKEQVA